MVIKHKRRGAPVKRADRKLVECLYIILERILGRQQKVPGWHVGDPLQAQVLRLFLEAYEPGRLKHCDDLPGRSVYEAVAEYIEQRRLR